MIPINKRLWIISIISGPGTFVIIELIRRYTEISQVKDALIVSVLLLSLVTLISMGITIVMVGVKNEA
jgi:hypothetical protein